MKEFISTFGRFLFLFATPFLVKYFNAFVHPIVLAIAFVLVISFVIITYFLNYIKLEKARILSFAIISELIIAKYISLSLIGILLYLICFFHNIFILICLNDDEIFSTEELLTDYRVFIFLDILIVITSLYNYFQ